MKTVRKEVKQMEEKHKRIGRPPTGLKRDKLVSFRLNEDEYNLIKKKAEQENLSINKYVFKKVFQNLNLSPYFYSDFGLVLRFMNGRGNLGLIFFEESSYFSLEVVLSVL